MHYESLTFFRPEEVERKQSTLAAEVYNAIRLLFNRNKLACQFVPIRSMQYQAVITGEEVVFVDSLGYAVRDGEGGRMIVMAWQFNQNKSRDSLTEPVSMDIVHYHLDMDDLERRLFVEFGQSMKLLLERQLETDVPQQKMKVVSINTG